MLVEIGKHIRHCKSKNISVLLDGIRNGGPRLEMPLSPAAIAIALASEKVGYLFLTFFIVWAGALDVVLLVLPHLPYPLPKREVKEEYGPRRGSGVDISIYERNRLAVVAPPLLS
jgi:hypothetical protein